MDLHVWPGSCHVDSFDSDCLIILTYLRLGKCPINLYSSITPGVSNMDNTPLLNHGDNKITGVAEIINYLRTENYGLEYELPDGDLAMLEALVGSIERRITPAVRWYLWHDEHAYRSYTSRLYGSALSWFYGFWQPNRWRRKVCESAEFSQLTHCTSFPTSKKRDEDISASLYEGARRCLIALSYVLGSKKFFFGDKPTAVDAYLFGRLWPLLNFDTNRNTLKQSPHKLTSNVYQCENLFQHCRRVQKLCFPAAASSILASQHASNCKSSDEEQKSRFWPSRFFGSSDGQPHPIRDTLLFGFGVLFVMTMFALGSGAIGVSSDADEAEDVDE